MNDHADTPSEPDDPAAHDANPPMTITPTGYDGPTNSMIFKVEQEVRLPAVTRENLRRYVDAVVESQRHYAEAMRRMTEAILSVKDQMAAVGYTLPPGTVRAITHAVPHRYATQWGGARCREATEPGEHTISDDWAASDEYKASGLCVRCLFGPYAPDALADEADPKPESWGDVWSWGDIKFAVPHPAGHLDEDPEPFKMAALHEWAERPLTVRVVTRPPALPPRQFLEARRAALASKVEGDMRAHLRYSDLIPDPHAFPRPYLGDI